MALQYNPKLPETLKAAMADLVTNFMVEFEHSKSSFDTERGARCFLRTRDGIHSEIRRKNA